MSYYGGDADYFNPEDDKDNDDFNTVLINKENDDFNLGNFGDDFLVNQEPEQQASYAQTQHNFAGPLGTVTQGNIFRQQKTIQQQATEKLRLFLSESTIKKNLQDGIEEKALLLPNMQNFYIPTLVAAFTFIILKTKSSEFKTFIETHHYKGNPYDLIRYIRHFKSLKL
jgi:hypothetical protein